VLRSYENYAYHVVFHSIYDFFTVDLSAVYLDVLKDRLYCSAKSSALRKSAQTALFHILRDSLLLMAPILPFTAEEAWEAMPSYSSKQSSVHLETFPSFEKTWLEPGLFEEWEALMLVREKTLKKLEEAREDKLIGNSLEAKITLRVPSQLKTLLIKYEKELPSLFIVSAVMLEDQAGEEPEVVVGRAPGGKCQRCWNYSPHVGKSAEYPHFCRRCEQVVRDWRS
jgi:isoleucyl-tRNA synthetase